MTDDRNLREQRRKFLAATATLPLALAAATLSQRQVLAATPECGHSTTPRQTAGPFFKPQSPQRASLIDAAESGNAMTLAGRVMSTSCQPVSGALIDFWHCDAKGDYDNRGYRFRGHQYADADGKFRLETLMPGLYPGRTRHIHVIVQAPNRRPLTTQLYFPGEKWNENDWIFDPVLLMKVAPGGRPLRAQFDFVLNLD